MSKKRTESKGASLAPPLRHRRQHHRPVHFAVLSVNVLIALGCLIGSGALVYGQAFLNANHKTAALPSQTSIHVTSTTRVHTSTTHGADTPGDTVGSSAPDTSLVSSDPTVTVNNLPPVDPHARNFLITGADNNACDDPNSTTQVGPRGQLGERSDTIMIMRVDPSTSRAAVLSFPRDLWVTIAGTNGKNRINAAYSQDDPTRLIQTIQNNFKITIDHYIQIDFCAFKRLVDAVGGVSVPFAYGARDRNTNLNIPGPGCYTFNGSEALAYVRSRHYQYLNPKSNKWTDDPTSDYGRIARQQDFMRRALSKVLSKGFDLGVISALIDVAKSNVVTDPFLTLQLQLQFADVLKAVKPAEIETYRIDGTGTVIGGADVILPNIKTDNMKKVLAIFQGTAAIQVPTATTVAPGSSSTSTSSSTTTTLKGNGTTTTLPNVDATENVPANAVVPPPNIVCP